MSSIKRNTLSLTALQVANVLLPLVTLPYLLRVLGPDQFGVYSLAQALPALGVVIADFGFNLTATQRIAEFQADPKAVSRYFWSVTSAKLLLAAVALILLAIVSLSVPQFRSFWPALAAGSLVIPASVFYPQWLFMGLERMAWITVCSVSARVATLPFLFMLVERPDQAWLAVLIAASAPILASVGACVLIRKFRLVHWHRPELSTTVQALKDGWQIFVSTAAISAYTTVTPIILGLLTHTAAVGLFSAADRVRQACQSLLTPLGSAAFPRINSAMSKDRDEGMRLIRRLLLAQGAMTLVGSALLWLTAPIIVRVFMGPQFADAAELLRILAPVLFVVGLSNVFGIQTMLPLGLKTPFYRIVVASGLINICLLLLLTPTFAAYGAAWAVLSTEVIVSLLMALALHRARINLFKNQFWSNRE